MREDVMLVLAALPSVTLILSAFLTMRPRADSSIFMFMRNRFALAAILLGLCIAAIGFVSFVLYFALGCKGGLFSGAYCQGSFRGAGDTLYVGILIGGVYSVCIGLPTLVLAFIAEFITRQRFNRAKQPKTKPIS